MSTSTHALNLFVCYYWDSQMNIPCVYGHGTPQKVKSRNKLNKIKKISPLLLLLCFVSTRTKPYIRILSIPRFSSPQSPPLAAPGSAPRSARFRRPDPGGLPPLLDPFGRPAGRRVWPGWCSTSRRGPRPATTPSSWASTSTRTRTSSSTASPRTSGNRHPSPVFLLLRRFLGISSGAPPCFTDEK